MLSKNKFVWTLVIFFLTAVSPTVYGSTKLKVGTLAPAFSLKDLEGKTVESKSFFAKSTFTVLVLWDSCCANCMRAVARLQTFYERVKKKFPGVAVLGINYDKKNIAAVRAFVKGQKITYPTLLDTQAKVAEAYRVELNNVCFYIIDKNGILRYIYYGHPPNICSILEKAIKELMER